MTALIRNCRRFNSKYALIHCYVLGMLVELSELLLSEDGFKEWNYKGEILPDPNLILNIDHLASFVQMEQESWILHCKSVNSELSKASEPMDALILFETKNIRFYLKSLFDIATYYIACIQATDKLLTQLYKLSTEYYELRIKKPKLEIDAVFHNKAQFIRDKSFIHQNSEKITNPMDKKTAMSWTPSLSCKSGTRPNCENYEFGNSKWWVKVNGIKTETEIDISITDLMEFASKASEQIEIRKIRIINYYNEIKQSNQLNQDK